MSVESMAESTNVRRDLILKEIELISKIVERLSGYGQATKKLAVTLWIAATSLAVKGEVASVHLIMILGVYAFWRLDAFFLTKERLFVARHHKLAELLAANPVDPPISDPMSLTRNLPPNAAQSKGDPAFGGSVWTLYVPLIIGSLLCWIFQVGS